MDQRKLWGCRDLALAILVIQIVFCSASPHTFHRKGKSASMKRCLTHIEIKWTNLKVQLHILTKIH